MKRKWNKSEIIKNYLISLINNNKDQRIVYSYLMLEILNINTNLEKVYTPYILPTFKNRFNSFTNFSGFIEDKLYSDLLNAYSWVQDESIFNHKINLKEIKFNDDELVDLAYEIISMMDYPLFLSEFKKITDPKKHIINIKKGTRTKGNMEVAGTTNYDFTRHKTYINLYESNTFLDLMSLVHEIMHSIMFNLGYYTDNYKEVVLFREVEGYFANLVTIKYLEEHGYEKDASELRKDDVELFLEESFKMMVSHILFDTASNNQFDFKKASDELNEVLTEKKYIIDQKFVNDFLVVDGLDTLTYMISYLVNLDLLELSLGDASEKIMELKCEENERVEEILTKHNFSFHQDGLKNLCLEYNKTHN